MTVFHPMGSRVLIRPDPLADVTAGGIHIPENARDQKIDLKTGTVISMGPGMPIINGPHAGERWPMPDGTRSLPDVRGKKVHYYGANDGIVTTLKIDDVEHHVLRDDNLDAFVNDEGELVPLNDRVIVRLVPASRQTSSGLWLPETSIERKAEGYVVAVGTGKIKYSGAIQPLSVAVGERIMFGKYAGSTMRMNGEELVVIRDEEIIGVVEEDDGPGIERSLLESEPAVGGAE